MKPAGVLYLVVLVYFGIFASKNSEAAPASRIAEVVVKELEVLPRNLLKREIPEFVFLRREFKALGKSRPECFLMDAKGTFSPLTTPASASEGDSRWGLEKVEPNKNSLIGFGKSSESPMDEKGIFLCFRSNAVDSPKCITITSGEDLAFGAEPLAFDEGKSQFYFWYYIGTSTDRRHALMVYSTADRQLAKIGETYGSLPQWSKDHQWLLWTSGEVYSQFNGMTLKTWNLRMYSVEEKVSYEITTGISTNNFSQWNVRKENVQ
jgi:hypothetical protein